MSLENDNSYGNIKVMFSEGLLQDMSPTFSQFLEDFIEGDDLYDEE
ncbi:hypothetical protein JL193_08130 [Polaribacter batillariae]|uniref:Uncharacterized protein n=1 Tax=Polaribacter batillariae TaxID=2808900 RepID=A0ABX7T2J9_9FLAO|nr:hypothetical protein [Polaribacter batillariae]QTD39194.1 hypothetical protein JL193_08130 [Polaribacter batillariae]